MASFLSRIVLAIVVFGGPAACTRKPPAASIVESTSPDSDSAQDQMAAATRGLAYAQEHCASCHLVVAGSLLASPDSRAPTFESIANMPGMTPTALNVWLHSAHPSMPNLITGPNELDELTAYIATLRRGKTRG